MFHTSGVGAVMSLLWCLTWMMTSRLVFSQETCSCSPLVYQWTLDFSNSCNFSSQGNANGEIGIAVGPQEGVQSATCSVKIEKPTVAVTEQSLQPVLVKGFQFVELGANLQRIKVMSNPLNFVPLLDGGVLEFTSEAASGMEMPSALIAFVFAENKDGDDIQLEWLIRFSTLCDVVPFQVGDSLGWMTFSGVTSARDETCKLASNVPTVVPSPLPTASPSLMPSNLMSSANNVLFTTNPNTMASASPTFLLTEQNSSPTAAAAATDTTTIDTTPSVVPSMAPSSPKWSKGTRSKSGKSSSSSSSKSSKNRSHSKSSSSKSASSKKSKKAKSTSGKSQKSQKRKKSVKSKSEKHVKHVKIQKSKEFNNRSLRGSLIPSSRRQLR